MPERSDDDLAQRQRLPPTTGSADIFLFFNIFTLLLVGFALGWMAREVALDVFGSINAKKARLLLLACTFAVPSIPFAVVALKGPRTFLALTECTSVVARPLRISILAATLALLLDVARWHENPQLSFSLLILTSIGVVIELRGLQISGFPISRLGATTLLLLMMSSYASYVGYFTVQKHSAFLSATWDLGIKESAVWNTLHGRFMWSSVEEICHVAGHTSFFMLTILPFYWLFPATETLLIYQAVIVALGAWPLYLIARHLLGSRGSSLFVVFLYLMNPALQAGNFYDFHILMAAPFLFFFAFFFWLKQKRALMFVFLLLLLLVKQDFGLIVTTFGVFTISHRRVFEGVLLCALGIVSFLIMARVVVPLAGGNPELFSIYFSDLLPPGRAQSTILNLLLDDPWTFINHLTTGPKILYFLQIFAPFLFLCFVDPRSLILLSYGLFCSFGASRSALFTIGFQYAIQLLPYAQVCSLLSFSSVQVRLEKWFTAPMRGAMMAGWGVLALVSSYHYGMIYPRAHFAGLSRYSFSLSASDNARIEAFLEVERLIPSEASIVASATITPHLIRRRFIQQFGFDGGRSLFRWPDFFVLFESDYKSSWLVTDKVVESGKYNLVFSRAGIVVLQRNASSPTTGAGVGNVIP